MRLVRLVRTILDKKSPPGLLCSLFSPEVPVALIFRKVMGEKSVPQCLKNVRENRKLHDLWWESPHLCGEGALQRTEKQSRLDHALERWLCQGCAVRALQVAENSLCIISGHDFSRAVSCGN